MLWAQVRSYVGPEKLAGALYGCDLVLIPAGVPRKPGMTRDDLFNINAGVLPCSRSGCVASRRCALAGMLLACV